MKYLIVTLISFFLSHQLIVADQAQGIWEKDLKIAKTKAKSEDKKILMVFSGSDWCIACMKLKTNILDKKEFINYAKKNLICLNLDFPKNEKNKLSKEKSKYNESLIKIYNKEGFFPKILLLNFKGQIISKLEYKKTSSKEYIRYIDSTMKTYNENSIAKP